LFGYVPGFSLQGDTMDSSKTFVLIIIGTYAYSWFLSGIWIGSVKGLFSQQSAKANK